MKGVTALSRLGMGALATVAVGLSPLLHNPVAQAQQVTNVAPTGQDVADSSTIAWQFDNPSLVDGNSLKVFLNDADVTSQSILDFSRNYFGYRPPQGLNPGTYKIRVEFSNKQGNGYAATWSFAVANTNLEITSVTHNAADKPLGKGASFLATVNGTPGAQASVLLVQNGQTVRKLPATAVSPGVYVASVAVGANDNVTEGIVVGRLEQSNRVVYSVAPQAFAMKPGTAATQVTQTQTNAAQPTPAPAQPTAPLDLKVTSHSDNGGVNGAFTLAGEATPGATVVVNVSASAPNLGGFLSIGSDETVVNNRSITVGPDGQFSVNVPRATVVQQGTTYSVMLKVSRGSEQKTVTMKLRQQ